MRYCTNCGHQLGIGRYCTNCGARVPVPPAEPPQSDDDFPTAVRPTAPPPLHPYGADPLGTAPTVPPPPMGPPPSAARYPLYADSPAPPPPPAAPPETSAALPVVVPTVPLQPAPRRRRSIFPWVLAFLVVAVIAAVGGILLLVGGSGKEAPAHGSDPTHEAGPTHRESPQSSAPAGEAGTVTPSDVQVPDTAPSSIDSDGEQVTFAADNMLDADPRTCWRMAGDGTGAVLTFTFDKPVTVTKVGLINGYAKTDPPHNWYDGNRRITDVIWEFDDGTEVAQELGSSTSPQTADVDDVTTTTIELRILGVTDPGEGPDARDFTAISDVMFSGR